MNREILDLYTTLQYNMLTTTEEIKNGFKIQYQYKPRPWIQEPIKLKMENARKLIGTNNPITNYFLMGGYENGGKQITRFQKEHKLYQAWVGTYIVTNENETYGFEKNTPILEKLIKLGNCDQKSWLKVYNDPQPECEMIYAKKLNTKLHSKSEANYFLKLRTHSDTNKKGAKEWQWNKLLGMPTTEKDFEEITLNTYYTAWQNKNTTVVAYACAPQDKWDEMQDELRQIIWNIKEQPLTILDKINPTRKIIESNIANKLTLGLVQEKE